MSKMLDIRNNTKGFAIMTSERQVSCKSCNDKMWHHGCYDDDCIEKNEPHDCEGAHPCDDCNDGRDW